MKIGKKSAITISLAMLLLGAASPAIAAPIPSPSVSSNQSDDSPPLPGQPEVTAGPGSVYSGTTTDEKGQAKAADIIGCTVIAEPPFTLVYNKAPIRAEGYINWCTPKKPDDCRTETDLELKINGIWTVVANGPVKWGCNVGSGSKSSTSYNCRQDLNGPHYYRTRTYIITQVNGVWAPNAEVATSGANSWWCE
ncbi:hypothetical protein [Streptosporangium minutum]|uniref:hypothetical protein n=1 Tax=Streptosporangium minutum TaxID=569862 RepID=UPI001056C87A|nr:hypothetical protein [Streptosporangium minutum]